MAESPSSIKQMINISLISWIYHKSRKFCNYVLLSHSVCLLYASAGSLRIPTFCSYCSIVLFECVEPEWLWLAEKPNSCCLYIDAENQTTDANLFDPMLNMVSARKVMGRYVMKGVCFVWRKGGCKTIDIWGERIMFELLVKGMTPKQVNKRTKHFQYTGLARTKFPICLILFRVCVCAAHCCWSEESKSETNEVNWWIQINTPSPSSKALDGKIEERTNAKITCLQHSKLFAYWQHTHTHIHMRYKA